ncbi:MAG: hypothetical protein ONB23_02480 [candidate division KSB1 bacterium]|nr:hypothetical protein [candidate division KSB1 bacterium]
MVCILSLCSAGTAVSCGKERPGAQQREGVVLQVVNVGVCITDGSVPLRHPRWSPDGSAIAAVSSDNNSLWLLRPDGSGLRKLTEALGVGSAFCWCDSSRLIAYRSVQYVGAKRILSLQVLDVKAGAARSLLETSLSLSPPVCCSTSRRIAVAIGDSVVFFGVRADRGGIAVESPPGQTSSRRGPACTMLLPVAKGLRIGREDLSGLVISEWPLTAPVLNASLSPGGRYVAVETLGSDTLRILDLERREGHPLGRGHDPVWSPRGDLIAWVESTENGLRIQQSDLVLYHVPSKITYRLTSTQDQIERDPCWAPDGRRLVYVDEASGRLQLAELAH